MIPASFEQSNHVIDKPDSMTREDCDALSVFQGTDQNGLPVMISCWKLTTQELEEINQTGRVWLWVFGGGMQPVSLTTEHPWNPREAVK